MTVEEELDELYKKRVENSNKIVALGRQISLIQRENDLVTTRMRAICPHPSAKISHLEQPVIDGAGALLAVQEWDACQACGAELNTQIIDRRI